MLESIVGDVLQPLTVFGGIAMVIWASSKARLEHRRMDMLQKQPVPQTNDDVMLTELKSLKQQIGEMQSTGHQFDISFDAALERMEQRVVRLETKAAVTPTITTSDDPTVLRNGQ